MTIYWRDVHIRARSIEERQALAEALPWVRRLKNPKKCQGWKAGKGEGFCKKPAHWRYAYSIKNPFAPGIVRYLCWNHLKSRALTSDMYEADRALKYWEKKGLVE